MLRQDEMLREEKESGADDAGNPRGDHPSGEDLRGSVDAPVDLLYAHGRRSRADETADE